MHWSFICTFCHGTTKIEVHVKMCNEKDKTFIETLYNVILPLDF